jgi:Tol biopolymer transport system component
MLKIAYDQQQRATIRNYLIACLCWRILTMTTYQHPLRVSLPALSLSISLSILVFLLSGCGGNGTDKTSSSPNGTDNSNLISTAQDFGGLTTRIIGTAQSPVLSTGYGSAVVGVAGATFSDITQSYVAPTLSNTKIAFRSTRDGNAKIYTMNADGTNQTRLTNNTTYDEFPSFSSDASKIAFTSQRDGNYEIYVMNADGSSQTNLTNNAAYESNPSFSPEGSKIAFASNRDGNYEIYTMNVDGTGQTNRTNNAATDYAPSFSPDGSKIALYSTRDGNLEIYVMNADGTNQIRLTNNVAADFSPSFSSDGSKIAFSSQRDGNTEIYLMNTDGTNMTRLTNNAAYDTNPSFSPDGTRISFESTRDTSFEIYSMNTDGTNVIRLTNNPAYDDTASWSGFRKPKYIGVGGLLGTECAGFLFGKQDEINTSILTFDTPTLASRAAARVTANTNTDTQSPNLAFTITTTTGLSNIKFINLVQSPITVTPALPPGTTNALVLFGANSGRVTDIVPYAANRGQSSTPVRVQNGDLATYTGKFSAIFDSNGKNIAPSGATSVTIDEKKGELIRFN